MLDKSRDRITELVIQILYNKFYNLPEDVNKYRSTSFHIALLNAFSNKFENFINDIPNFVSLISWLHDFNTTSEQTFFEGVAHILSDGSKREYTSKRSGNLLISQYQKQAISNIITDLNNGNEKPCLERENKFLFNNKDVADTYSLGFSADVFIEEEDEIIAIELKAVRPNSGEVRGENDTEYNKKRFMSSIINMEKYFAKDEVLLSSELWDYLSGEKNTMEQILEIINSVATTEFMEIYEYINNNDNRNTDKYKQCLSSWNLSRELFIVNNIERIEGYINSKYKRIYNQPIFKDGEYNINRFITLNDLIRQKVGQ